MKISKLIDQLTKYHKLYGDIDVSVLTSHNNEVIPIEIESIGMECTDLNCFIDCESVRIR